jgi:hypothetical protein
LDLNSEHLTRYFESYNLDPELVEASVIKSDQIEPIDPHSTGFDPVTMYLTALKVNNTIMITYYKYLT